MDFDNGLMKRVWSEEQEILDVIHKICVDNNLKYSLAYGTLLGAVRHGGFIPWDDDIDIMMPRKDYTKFKQIWNDSAPKGYIYQDYNTDTDIVNNFAKIRKNNTTFLQSETERGRNYHKGFFVDIFPVDNVANGKLSSQLQYFAAAVNLLYTRGYQSGSGGLMGKIEKLLLSTKKENYIKRRNKAERYFCRWNDKKCNYFTLFNTILEAKKRYPIDLLNDYTVIKFNGKEYFAIKDYDRYLTITYGDYMKLPPEEERVWFHHPILIDFEHNYEDIDK